MLKLTLSLSRSLWKSYTYLHYYLRDLIVFNVAFYKLFVDFFYINVSYTKYIIVFESQK